MLKPEQQSLSLSIHHELYDILIKEDNIWKQINNLVDFQFINEILQDSYSSSMGRVAESPIRLFKFLLLKNYYKLSDVDVVKRTRTDLEFKYFLGYSPEETELIDPSLLTVFRRQRLSKYTVDEEGKKTKVKDSTNEMLDTLLSKTVEIAIEKGIIQAKNKIIVDATHTNAIYRHVSPIEELKRQAKELRKSIYKIDESMKDTFPKKVDESNDLDKQVQYTKELLEVIHKSEIYDQLPGISERINKLEETNEDTMIEIEYSKDEEAKVGHKTADSDFYGYKTHISITPERIITAAIVTTGEKHDGKQLQELIKKSQKAGIEVEAVIGDGAYSEKDNLEYCKEHGIENISRLSNMIVMGNSKRCEGFEYNKDAQMFVCKAGHMASKKTHTNGNKYNNYSKVDTYFFDVEKCKRCPLKDNCYKEGAKTKSYSVTHKKEIHKEQMDFMETDYFKENMKERYKIEAKNGELKKVHGYGQANSCGISGMTIQGASTLFLVNLKRIIKLSNEQ